MSKATEQNDKLKRAIIISAVLHVILFAALIWSSFDENIEASAGGGGGSSIDAVMVDSGAVVEQYNDIFGELSSGKNAPKTGGGAKGNNASPAGSGNTKNNGASGADINNYAGQIKSAIESKFYDASSYAGKTCTLRIKLAPDGMLLDIKPEGGDPALCQAALAAAKLAKIPKPPSQAVYEVFKNAPLDFKP